MRYALHSLSKLTHFVLVFHFKYFTFEFQEKIRLWTSKNCEFAIDGNFGFHSTEIFLQRTLNHYVQMSDGCGTFYRSVSVNEWTHSSAGSFGLSVSNCKLTSMPMYSCHGNIACTNNDRHTAHTKCSIKRKPNLSHNEFFFCSFSFFEVLTTKY